MSHEFHDVHASIDDVVKNDEHCLGELSSTTYRAY